MRNKQVAIHISKIKTRTSAADSAVATPSQPLRCGCCCCCCAASLDMQVLHQLRLREALQLEDVVLVARRLFLVLLRLLLLDVLCTGGRGMPEHIHIHCHKRCQHAVKLPRKSISCRLEETACSSASRELGPSMVSVQPCPLR